MSMVSWFHRLRGVNGFMVRGVIGFVVSRVSSKNKGIKRHFSST